MALISAAQFSNYLNPDGTVGPPANAATPVTLALSDGNTITIADQKVTALSLMEAMRQRRQWMIQLSDDVFAISIGATKIMFCENSLTLQRWVTSFHGVYLHGSTLFSHRNMSQQATLYESLLQSGQLFRTTQSIVGNADLGEVYAVLLDWYWPASLLVDSPAIRYTP
jgi:hypothetical protein